MMLVSLLLGLIGSAFVTPAYDEEFVHRGRLGMTHYLVIQPLHYTPEGGTQHAYYYTFDGEPTSEEGWYDLGNIPRQHALFWDLQEARPGVRYLALQQRDANGHHLGSWITDKRWITRVVIK